MKRLLAVSWEMPPMYGPRATQVTRSLTGLGAIGWRPTVVCMSPRRGGPHWPDGVSPGVNPGVNNDAPAGVELIRVPSPEEWTIVRAAWRLAPPLRDYPDTKRFWISRATAAAAKAAVSRAATATPFNGLVTFAQPWSSHLVGLRVHRATSLPWVAHFSDPWADSPYATTRQQSIWRRMEADVIREARAVVFVTDETADLVMKKYPVEWRDKAAVVPHAFDSCTALTVARSRRPGPLRLVYTGRFYSGVRTPIALLRALASMNAREPLSGLLEVIFIGPHVEEFKRDTTALGLDSVVRFRGRVSQSDAAAAAADADVLLVVDAPSAGPSVFLPSKLIDYLALRKPIFGVTPREGASATLLRRLGCPVAPPDDVEAIAAALVELVRQWRDGTLGVSEQFDRVAAEFTIERTSAQLNGVLVRAFGRS